MAWPSFISSPWGGSGGGVREGSFPVLGEAGLFRELALEMLGTGPLWRALWDRNCSPHLHSQFLAPGEV